MKVTNMVVLLVISVFSVFANSGGYTIDGAGGAVVPVKNNSITMEKEFIYIDVIPEGFNYFRVEYDCIFHFRNKTDPTQEVLIGFPHKYEIYMEQGEEYGDLYQESERNPVVKDFKFRVNGKEVKYEVYPAEANPAFTDVPAYDYVHTAEVHFSPGEEKIIRNSFSMNKIINCIPDPAMGSDENKSVIDYILRTGASWKGPIGSSEITVTFHDRPENTYYVESNIKPDEISGNHDWIVYRFSNFVPDKDIRITFGFSRLSDDETIKQITTYFDKKDFDTVRFLLWKWDVITA